MYFYTTRDISSGEELCISYIDTKDDVKTRRQSLKLSWYFDCACGKCTQELESETL